MNLKALLPLPELASAHGHKIDFMIYVIHLLMLVLFVGWGIYFVYVLIRFNKRANPKASYEGMHSPIATFVEVGVAVFEGVLLVGLSIPFWAQQVDALPDRPDTLEVRVVAEQFAWNIHYPGADGKFGRTDIKFFDAQTNPLGLDPNDPNGKDDVITINQFHVPIGRPVLVRLSSKDVVHSFFVPAMRVKQDAIPGMSIPVWFVPTKLGQYDIACAQLCGLGHYRMKGYLTVETESEFEQWLASQTPSQNEGEEVDDFWL